MIQSLFTSASRDAIVVMNEQDLISEWNLAAQKLFYYSREEALGQHLHLLIIPPRLLEDADRGVFRFQEQGEGEFVGKVTEMIVQRKDGHEFPIELSISAIQVDTHWHAIAIIRDITEHKRVEAELKAAKELAEVASKAKSEFLARVGHELLTPLNAVIGFAQVMEMSPDDETLGAYRDSLNTITQSGWQLHRIIKELLNLSELDSQEIQLYLERIDAGSFIRECCELLEPLACQYGVELHYADIALEGVMILVDPLRLHEALTKLIDNAIKYNKEGGQVTLTAQPVSGCLRIYVSDTGQGIPDIELATLFQPFSRLAQRSYSIEGGGVGLSIAQKLVGLMGGEIAVESVLGQGSTFWIELPISTPIENT